MFCLQKLSGTYNRLITCVLILSMGWTVVCVVAFPGHTHFPFGFPAASQAKYFCELDIRF